MSTMTTTTLSCASISGGGALVSNEICWSQAVCPLGRVFNSDVVMECSGRGICNDLWQCDCDDGFTGIACERTSCPSDSQGNVCSGHGICVPKPVSAYLYSNFSTSPLSNWIQACQCDYGWGFHDCSQRMCEVGVDPLLIDQSNPPKVIYHLDCQASDGNLQITLNGYTVLVSTTATIEDFFNTILSLNIVRTMSIRSANSHICGKETVTTTSFELYLKLSYSYTLDVVLDFFNQTATQQDNNNFVFSSLGTVAVGREFSLKCNDYFNHHGDFFFVNEKFVSPALTLQTAQTSDIVSAMSSLFYQQGIFNPRINITFSSSTNICLNATTTTTTFVVFTEARFLQNLQLVQESSVLSLHGTDPIATECSNQGLCDHSTGKCNCIVRENVQAESSDGMGNKGNIGNCGFVDTLALTCVGSDYENCSNRGVCDSLTGLCACKKGWQGFDCSIPSCSKNHIWFHNNTIQSTSSPMAECSGVGICDRSITGQCVCPSGFSGASCDYWLYV